MKTVGSFCALILIAVLMPLAAAAQRSDPASSIRSFYALDGRTSQIFNRRNLDIRRPYLSKRLYDLFREELRKQAALKRSSPDDKPFFGDGFPFRPTDEPCVVNGRSYPRLYSLKPAPRYKGSRAEIPVSFSYPRPCTEEPIIYKLRVVRAGSKWLIDDILYDDGSTLSDAMKSSRP